MIWSNSGAEISLRLKIQQNRGIERRVQVPPSPLFLSRQSQVCSYQPDERLLKRSASPTQTVSRTYFARWTMCLLQNEKNWILGLVHLSNACWYPIRGSRNNPNNSDQLADSRNRGWIVHRKRTASQTQNVSRTRLASLSMCLMQNEKTGSQVCSILQIVAGTPLVDQEVIPLTVYSWPKSETGGRSFTENVKRLPFETDNFYFEKRCEKSTIKSR